MNVSQYADEAAQKAYHGEAAAKEANSNSSNDESHQGLMKRIWDKLTQQQQKNSKRGH